MALEDPEVIDMIGRPEPGKIELVITDGGQTTDPAERIDALLAKLRTYVGYALSEEFADEHPDAGPDGVSIVVVCATPPTPEMLQVSHVKPHAQPGRLIPVRFLLYADGQFTECEPESPPVDRDRILPRLVTRAFVARVPPDNGFPHRPLGDTGLFVAYVVDGDDSVRYVMGPLVDEVGLGEEDLYELALTNLGKTFDFDALRESVRKHSITAVKCLDTFDAARLLLVPRGLRPGEAVAALVPDRDTLTLLPVPHDGNWLPLAELAKVPASDHLLLDRPLRVTHDGFEMM